MDAVVEFIANSEATKPVEPGECALDDPAEHAKPAAVGVRQRPKIATIRQAARRSQCGSES